MIEEKTAYVFSVPPPPVEARSPHWPAARSKWLANNPTCAFCGTPEGVEVHHKIPVHVSPGYELDEGNFLTACRLDHFRICHAGNWRDWTHPRQLTLLANMMIRVLAEANRFHAIAESSESVLP